MGEQMNTEKRETETYILTNIDGLDPVTIYVTNYKIGQGKIVIECFGDVWSYFWGGLGNKSLQEFFVSCDNSYILNKLLKKTTQTDFEEINNLADKRGFPEICVSSDVDVAMQAGDMDKCFGDEWYMELPTCETTEYWHLSRIVDAIKDSFKREGDSYSIAT
ncbi:MAG: hypothetical protein QNK20_04180, partial [Aureibaculum sp.]|nr:hypothetical protein [Aureibaculum sp.]